MKSLFRFIQMKDSFMPQPIIDTEKNLLESRFCKLKADDLYVLFTEWPKFQEDEKARQEIQDKKIDDDFKREILDIN